MASEWYYARNKQKVGPVTFEQLKELARSGELVRTNMVLRQGTPKWMEASQVEGLFESGPPQAVPPPLPPATPPVPVAEWYIVKGDQQQGPVTIEQLRAMAASSDLVWKAGMPQWVTGSAVPGLFGEANSPKPIPPPIPGVPKASVNIAELLKTGRQKTARGEYQLALDAFMEVIRLDQTNADAYFGRGMVHYEIAYRTNNYREAITDFREALRLNPHHQDAKLYLQEAQQRHQEQSPPSSTSPAIPPPGSDGKGNRPSESSEEQNAGSTSTRTAPLVEQYLTADWTFQCPQCRKSQTPKGDSASVFWCPDCGYKSEYTIGYLKRKHLFPSLQGQQGPGRLGKERKKAAEAATAKDRKKAAQPMQSHASATVDLMPYPAFLAQRPVTPVFIHADCQLERSHYYYSHKYENASATHYVVKVGDLSKWKICMETAFLRKTSEAGEELYDVLKDGLPHKVIMQVAFQGPNGEPASDCEEFAILGTQAYPFIPQEVGISDPTVAKQVAHKKAAARWHAKPVKKKSLSEPEHTVFSGDAPCPKCKTAIWVEWENTTVEMACPKCGFRFDHDQAIAFLSAHKPEDNYKADQAAAAVEAVEVLERAKALIASHEAASEDVEDDDEVEPDPISMICPHCLAHYRARIRVGDTARCDHCLEDFVVYALIGEPSKGFLEGLNPLAWFFEKCPQCRSAPVRLGRIEKRPEWLAADTLWHGFADYYLCKQCRITWLRSYGFRT